MGVREQVETAFAELFGPDPDLLVRAPGRVNLIGEHTDYNDGFVLPMAIDREVWIALRPRRDTRVVAHSLDFDETAELDTAALSRGDSGWFEYVKGAAAALGEAGRPVAGWEGVIGGNVPIGAGLSSSAALELATLRAFAAVAELAWEPTWAALLGQRVENHWIGVSSGIMDQLVVAAGRAGHAMLIDCRSLAIEPVPIPADAAIVVLDTDTRRGLLDSAYNRRRRQCEAAAAAFGVPALRDVDLATFEAGSVSLDPITRRRARHVVTENRRTLEAADALRSAELERLGALMNASHASLRDDFEVTSDALNTIVQIAQDAGGCYGARMTGAGFGGCAVALVEADRVSGFIAEVVPLYASATGRTARAYACRAVQGASVEVLVR